MRIRWLLPGALVACALLPPSAHAVSSVDLLTDASAQTDGGGRNLVHLGKAVGGGGDVNGDGRRDVLFSADSEADVLFGRWDGVFDLGDLLGRGFPYSGSNAVVNAGDVNADGFDDILAADPEARGQAGSGAGRVCVVFGSASAATGVSCDALGARGFLIEGSAQYDRAGTGVDAAGDVNGDGRDDILVGAPGADPRRTNAGATYVVFGKASTSTVDLRRLGAGGYRIDGAAPGDQSGTSVANAGDVNGDGRPDQLIGAPYADPSSRENAGAAYITYGKAGTAAVDLGALGGAGYRIAGAVAVDLTGRSVDNAGDVNGDGRPDQILIAPGAYTWGLAYVVHGRGSNVDLNGFSSGYRIEGTQTVGLDDATVAGVGDVSGDGRADQVIGAPYVPQYGRGLAGAAYVVFGKTSTTSFRLDSYGTGYRIDGARSEDLAGSAVAGPGNVTGDGRRDILVGAKGMQRDAAGAVYAVAGGSEAEESALGNLSVGGRVVIASAGAAATRRGRLIRFRLRRAARVRLLFYRLTRGRRSLSRSGRVRCVARTARVRRPRRRVRCTRARRVARISRRYRRRGRKRVHLGRRIGRHRLKPGRYLLVAYARDRRGRSHGPVLARFRVVRRR